MLQPQWPYCLDAQLRSGCIKEKAVPPFYPVNQMLSLFIAALMGLQHALAMIGEAQGFACLLHRCITDP